MSLLYRVIVDIEYRLYLLNHSLWYTHNVGNNKIEFHIANSDSAAVDFGRDLNIEEFISRCYDFIEKFEAAKTNKWITILNKFNSFEGFFYKNIHSDHYFIGVKSKWNFDVHVRDVNERVLTERIVEIMNGHDEPIHNQKSLFEKLDKEFSGYEITFENTRHFRNPTPFLLNRINIKNSAGNIFTEVYMDFVSYETLFLIIKSTILKKSNQ
ncbi:hypothetical protein [Flavobacterium beibuense]|uniref:hypothetical protein n=1 Tax=Flavobacterium beibuense TaxID=657326 RepID=UPI003A9055DF